MQPTRLVLFLLLAAAAVAKKPVTLDEAARESRPLPSPVWSPDGARFVWRDEGRIFLYDVAARRERELLDTRELEGAAKEPPPPDRFQWVNRGVRERELQWFPSGKQLLLRVKGDLFSYDIETSTRKQLTKTAYTEHDPKVSPDGRRISFRAGHDLYAVELSTLKVTRLTADGSATLLNGELDWVYPEELALSTAHWWSPDSRRIAYLQFDVSVEMSYPHADILGVRPVAEPERYPQAGTANPVVRLGVVGAGGGKTKWLDTGATAQSLLARVTWLDSARLAVHALNRVQDRLDLVAVDAAGGRAAALFTERAKTWINLRDDFAFLKDGSVVWGSDSDGWRHFYRRRANGDPVAQLTKGQWEVISLECVDETARRVFFVSTQESPTERQLYSVSLDGGEPARVSSGAGTHNISMSPGCGHYIDTYSNLKSPARRTLHSAAGEPLAVLAERDANAAADYDLVTPELLTFTGSDGALFHARLTRPAAFDPAKKYPAIVMVYGGPHSQTVRDTWRGADWEQALAHRGFVVWQMDNRGAAGRGHLWEAPLYRRFGKQELADQLEGVRHLVSLGFVDAGRIGIYGWSYGGYMTLYSLLHSPDTFRAGVSGAPVTDWRNYDTIYTERYMGLPSENEEGYKLSSPVHFADRLKGRLMLAHNFEDDNVLFQHTLRMMDALQRAGKQFDLLLYPQKAHGVSGDRRKHMLEAMTGFFERHLKP